MKFILRIIWMGICILLTLGLFVLLINDSFIKENYKTKFMDGDGIPLPRFVYKVDWMGTNKDATFLTFVEFNELVNKKDSYLKDLTKCYDKFYYDEKNGITISDYTITDKEYYRQMHLKIDFYNYCSDRYILSDTWFNDYKNMGKIDDLNVKVSSLVTLMNEIEKSKRVIDPSIKSDYTSEYSISYSYSQKSVRYYMEIKDFSENEVVVIKTRNEEKQFAVYEIENAKEFLKKLM